MDSLPAAVQSLHDTVTNKSNPNTNPNRKIIKLVTEAHFQTQKMASNNGIIFARAT